MSKSRPRVYARLRPLNNNELQNKDPILFQIEGRPISDTLAYVKDQAPMRTRFDRVFGPDSTQEDVFDQIGKEVVDSLTSGYNSSVFAYGQTGSGKTHTMEGDLSNPVLYGLIPRLINHVFERLSQSSEVENVVARISYVQIYQERIQDLLQDRRVLEIHMDRSGHYIAQGALWVQTHTVQEVLQIYTQASRLRATNATEMNLVSSRSHAILMMHIQWDEPQLPGLQAQLNLIDLAGSEKLYQSGATGEIMKEAISINKSLSALGNVVSKLVDAAKHPDRRIHIPYKDSKLTYLLQSSLGGSNLVHFLLTMSASGAYQSESLATVEFGKRALQLVLRPVRNPIDYKRLEEMEMMIEKMRNQIKNLEEELRSRPETGRLSDGSPEKAQAFLHMNQIHQDGEKPKSSRRQASKLGHSRSIAIKAKTELSRIVNNLPETMEDLTSHCILFPEAKQTFRELGGLKKLVQYIERSPSIFYKAHAAHTIAYVVDDEGRVLLGDMGCVESVGKLLGMKEERCKEAACVALEALMRYAPNKKHVELDALASLCELINGYGNQQVQEAACSALAAIVDGEPEIKNRVREMHVSEKLALAIVNSPPEVTNVIKAATTAVGRLAHGDQGYQQELANLGCIELLVDRVLFCGVGERDHQVPILASYALVNLCCSNKSNLQALQKHPRYEEICFKLMEGLARAFGSNTIREGFGKASAQECDSVFPYFGVTLLNEWTPITSGGRPIFSTFAENPQFYLYISTPSRVTILIQDAEYEARMQRKIRRNTVYMGLAVFKGEPELIKNGLKQLDFHGRMVEIAKYTSNCENVLNCNLQPSETPYILVPFTSQLGRSTTFGLSAFADSPLDLTPVPDSAGWHRRLFEGTWTSRTGCSGESFDWRNNPQIQLTVSDTTRVVMILSYVSLDEQRLERAKASDESCDIEEKPNVRPRLHVRMFQNVFAPEKRYVRSLVPGHGESTYIAGNNFSSNSYVTLSAVLTPDTNYVCIPFVEEHNSTEERWRLSIFSDNELSCINALQNETEWSTTIFSGTWRGEGSRVRVSMKGRMCLFAVSDGLYLRLSVSRSDNMTKLASNSSYFVNETFLEFSSARPIDVLVNLDGVQRRGAHQSAATTGIFTFVMYHEDPAAVFRCMFEALPPTMQPAYVKSLIHKDMTELLTPEEYGTEVTDTACALRVEDPEELGEWCDEECEEEDEEDEECERMHVEELDELRSVHTPRSTVKRELTQSSMKKFERASSLAGSVSSSSGHNNTIMNELIKVKGERDVLKRELQERDELIRILQEKANLSPSESGSILSPQNQRSSRSARSSVSSLSVNTAAASRPPTSQGSTVSSARRQSVTNSPTSVQNPSPTHNINTSIVVRSVADKLTAMSALERIPSAHEWNTMRKDMKDLQMRLRKLK